MIATTITGPQSAVEWTQDKNVRRALERLVNAVERREDQSTHRKNATLAREFVCACPREMTTEENWNKGKQFATDVSQRLGVVVILSLDAFNPDSTQTAVDAPKLSPDGE